MTLTLATPVQPSSAPQVSAQSKTPDEIWLMIFDLITSIPNYIPAHTHPALSPQELFDAYSGGNLERGSIKADSSVLLSMRARLRLVQVCKRWRDLYLPKAYEVIHMGTSEDFARLLEVLKGSCITGDPKTSSGKWTKSLSYRLQPVKGGQFPPDVVTAMVESMAYFPNLVAFTPSPHIGHTEIPKEILQQLSTTPVMDTLQYFALLGSVDLAEVVPFIHRTRALTTLALGQPWNVLGTQPLIIPHLQSLHVEVSQWLCSYLDLLAAGEYPMLRSLTVILRHHSQLDRLTRLLDSLGHTIEFLEVNASRGYWRNSYLMQHIQRACPRLQFFTFNFKWIAGATAISSFTSLQSVGLFMSYYSAYHLSREESFHELDAFFNQKFPPSLKLIRLYDFVIHELKDDNLTKVALPSWIRHCSQRGIRVENGKGELLRVTPEHILA